VLAAGVAMAAAGWYAGSRGGAAAAAPVEDSNIASIAGAAHSSFDRAEPSPSREPATAASPLPSAAPSSAAASVSRDLALPSAPPVPASVTANALADTLPAQAQLVRWSEGLPGAKNEAAGARTVAYVIEAGAPEPEPERPKARLQSLNMLPFRMQDDEESPRPAYLGSAPAYEAVPQQAVQMATSIMTHYPEMAKSVIRGQEGMLSVPGDLPKRFRAGQCPPGTKNEGCRCQGADGGFFPVANAPQYCSNPDIQRLMYAPIEPYRKAWWKNLGEN
jgi:hypothetical protein